MIHIFNTYDDLSQHTAETILSIGHRTIQKQNIFHLVLSGGNTPKPVYEKLANDTRTDREFWLKTHIYWGDERCVPPDDPQSNYYMAYLTLLSHIPVPRENIHRIKAELPDHQNTILQYEAKFPKNPDLVILGMGEDGHTASLFPRSPALEITDQYFVRVVGSSEPKYRITITPPAIQAAKEVMVLVSGANKADALSRVFQEEGSISETPARLVIDRSWFIDKDAAEEI
jgi:6-phosphogluconolactonase